MKTFNYRVILNTTQGFGNTVLKKVHDANIVQLINDNLGNDGKVTKCTEKWNSGIFSHDLYLHYELEMNCYELIKHKKNVYLAKFLRFLNLHNYVIKNIIRNSIQDGFMKELKGKGIIVILKSCEIL
jgi:hypothetical protein